MTTQKELLNAGGNTIVVFSKLEKVITLNPEEVRKMALIVDLLKEKSEENENEDKEMLYGSILDAFEEESYFTNTNKHGVKPRNLKVVQLEENSEIFNTTLIAFGYLNSKDIYLEPSDLELFAEDLYWFVNDSNRCKDETKPFVLNIADAFKAELQAIENNCKNNSIDVEDL